MKTILTLLTFIVIFFTGLTGVRADHEWERWGQRNRVHLVVGSSVDARWQAPLAEAVRLWSTTAYGNPVRLTIVPSNNPNCDFVIGRIEACSANLGDDGANAITVGKYDEQGNVIAMKFVFNDHYFPKSEENEPIHVNDRYRLACHELGHALGLDHQDETGADVGTCLDFSGEKWYPNRHDYEQLVAMYGRYRFGYSIYIGQIAARYR